MGHAEWPYPDLIVVDGNTIQKSVAEKVIKKVQLFIPVVAVVKDEHHRPKNILGTTKLIEEHEASILLANAEAHRFAITFHRKKRSVLK
jgi:excinuclease ABC subunit C